MKDWHLAKIGYMGHGWQWLTQAGQPVTQPSIDEESNIKVIHGVSNTNFGFETPCLYFGLQNRGQGINV